MILKKLSILNYKNILQAEVAFSPKMNCFFGCDPLSFVLQESYQYS